MENRVIASSYKYGDLGDAKRDLRTPRDELKNARYRLKLYERTGNSEYLVDAANFLMFEFMEMKGHFLATDGNIDSKIV